MAIWKVHGADIETGKDVTATVVADSGDVEGAMAKARAEGVYPSSATEIEDREPSSLLSGIVVGAVLVVFAFCALAAIWYIAPRIHGILKPVLGFLLSPDTLFLVVGIGLTRAGAKMRDSKNERTGGGIVLMTIGIVLIVLATLIFCGAFLYGYIAARSGESIG